MAAFTDQVRRFEEEISFQIPLGLRGPGTPLPALPLAKVLQKLNTQILALILDTSIKEREASCKSAVGALKRAGRHTDIDTSTLGFVANLPRFSAMRSLTSRNRVSERLGALAAWKWVDLHDELNRSPSSLHCTTAIDDLLATVSTLVFEAMVSLGGELTTMSDNSHAASAAARRRRLSEIAHEGKRRRHEPMQQTLLAYALRLRKNARDRNEHLWRSDAVVATLLHFKGLPGLPASRTLHDWLAAAGWVRNAASIDDR